jgi:ABC-type lipoprotein release transport system permease subunit
VELVKLAWRNLWRNRRRTLITAASVLFALFFALLMRAFQLGSYDLMVSNIVHAYSGYFQVHANGYWDDKVINNSFELIPEIEHAIKGTSGISGYAYRLESFALASFGLQTKGVMVNGIDPVQEDEMISLRQKLTDGHYLEKDDDGVLVSRKLAGFLKIAVGDTLVLIGQGYHGTNAAGIFPVRGILKFPSPDLDSRMVYLSLPACQSFLSAENRLTGIAFNVQEGRDFQIPDKALKARLDPEKYEVMSWKEMMPDVVQQIQADNASGLIMLAILYMIIGFGIFGTILMMFSERIREFGMMIAVGMHKIKLLAVLITEMIMIGVLGITGGFVLALLVIYYFHLHPIPLTGEMAETTIQMGFEPVMPVAWEISYFAGQSLSVLVIAMLIMIFPVIWLARLRVITALRK